MGFKTVAQLAFVSGLALASGAAVSQVTGVVTSSIATTSIVGTGLSLNYVVPISTDVGYEGGYAGAGAAWTFTATAQLEPDYITFRNGGAASGLYAVTTTQTIIDITFMNDGATTVRPVLNSTILPAGMGLFLANASCLDSLRGCAPGSSDVGAAGFGDFLPNPAGSFGQALAGATFDFKVTGNGTTIYTLSGGVGLVRNGSGINELITDLGAAQAALDGFKVNSPAGSDQEYGVDWGATNFTVDFAAGTELAPGSSGTLRYETTVTSYVQAACLIGDDACLVAYSAFGDPIGRGGGSDPSANRSAARSLLPPLPVRNFTPEEDDPLGVDGTFQIPRPTFRNGVLTFVLPPAVPEPATWAMMLMGTALAGAALRRRKAAPVLRVH